MTLPRWVLIATAIAALAAGLVTTGVHFARDRSIAVREDSVRRRDLIAVVTASGRIQPKKKVDVSADITGRITTIAVHEGDHVRRGQFLLQIDPTVYEADLQRAEAALSAAEADVVQAQANRDQAERALTRSKELRDRSPTLIAPEQFEQAQTGFDIADANLTAAVHQVDQARAGVQAARDNLRKTRLVAPMSGRVTRLPVEEGEVAVPNTFSKDIGLLMTISDLSVVQAKVQVDETDVVRLRLGDSVDVAIDAFPDTSFTAHVTKVSNSSTETPATAAAGQNEHAVNYEVEVTLDHPPADVRPDLSATARIVTDTRTGVLSIPIIALTTRETVPVSTEINPIDTTNPRLRRRETEGVFVVTRGLATFRPVRVGIAGDEYFEVLSGLKEGTVIAAGPYQVIRNLKDGARVRPLKEKVDSLRTSAPD